MHLSSICGFEKLGFISGSFSPVIACRSARQRGCSAQASAREEHLLLSSSPCQIYFVALLASESGRIWLQVPRLRNCESISNMIGTKFAVSVGCALSSLVSTL